MLRTLSNRAQCACLVVCTASLIFLPSLASAQAFDSRGFADGRLFVYPQTAPNDSTRAVAEALFRYEPTLTAGWLRAAAALDARMDTHAQVERRWYVDWEDRGVQRPPFSVRRLSATISRSGLSVELGKQFIRWGKADILNPTDRFAPRDFLTVVDNEFLGVTGARLLYERAGNGLDVVWVPHFTPSRIPLFDQRWSTLPAGGVEVLLPQPPPSRPRAAFIPFADGGARYPGGSQEGIRFNRSGAGYEFSLSFYNGFNHLPLIDARFASAPPSVELVRYYAQMRMYGGDVALPNRWFTLKAEFGYFTSTTQTADEYGLYVVQAERQVRDWLFVAGYSGDFVTRHGVTPTPPGSAPAASASTSPGFAIDRGLSRSFLGRAAFTIDAARDLAFQAAVRQNGEGIWLKGEYSQTYGGHLRATVEGNWIHGSEEDFIGQYHHNSNVNVRVRYSF
ncbi:MAG: hypothetical protein ACM3NQ_02130 [Bacteroidales bacterium]